MFLVQREIYLFLVLAMEWGSRDFVQTGCLRHCIRSFHFIGSWTIIFRCRNYRKLQIECVSPVLSFFDSGFTCTLNRSCGILNTFGDFNNFSLPNQIFWWLSDNWLRYRLQLLLRLHYLFSVVKSSMLMNSILSCELCQVVLPLCQMLSVSIPSNWDWEFAYRIPVMRAILSYCISFLKK